MGRSPGFGSTACDFHPLRGHALFRLAFAAAPGVSPLASPRTVTRRLILQKARHQPACGLLHKPRPLTVCRSKVSGFYFTPLPGYFSPFPHGTLHYRSPRVFSLTQWSARIPPGFRVSRGTRVLLHSPIAFRLQGCHLLWRWFPPASAKRRFCNCVRARQGSMNSPTTPRAQRLPPWHAHGLGCSAFDRLY